MTRIPLIIPVLLGFVLQAPAQQKTVAAKTPAKDTSRVSGISYKKDVFPILKMHCLPCHTEDQMNPSDLYLDSYDGLMAGGKHGKALLPGKADSSLIIKKLLSPPPFGDLMPLKAKTPLAEDSIAILKKWIDQGGKDN